MNAALERLRDTAALGPVTLSDRAVWVIHQFLRAWDDPERQGGEDMGEWNYRGNEALSGRALRDFQDCRLVDLGDMTRLEWRARRARLWVYVKVFQSWYQIRRPWDRWRTEREISKQLMRKEEEAERRAQWTDVSPEWNPAPDVDAQIRAWMEARGWKVTAVNYRSDREVYAWRHELPEGNSQTLRIDRHLLEDSPVLALMEHIARLEVADKMQLKPGAKYLIARYRDVPRDVDTVNLYG